MGEILQPHNRDEEGEVVTKSERQEAGRLS